MFSTGRNWLWRWRFWRLWGREWWWRWNIVSLLSLFFSSNFDRSLWLRRGCLLHIWFWCESMTFRWWNLGMKTYKTLVILTPIYYDLWGSNFCSTLYFDSRNEMTTFLVHSKNFDWYLWVARKYTTIYIGYFDCSSIGII